MPSRLLLFVSGLCAVATAGARQPGQARWPADRYQLRRIALDSAPQCRATVPVLTPDSLGPLWPGESLQELERACPRLLYVWSWTDEGIPTPAVWLQLGGARVLAAFSDTLATSRMLRLLTHSRLVRTAEGFGPGSRLWWISQSLGPLILGTRECALYARFRSRPELIFRVDPPDSWGCGDIPDILKGQRAELPRTTTVREVLLVRGPGQ